MALKVLMMTIVMFTTAAAARNCSAATKNVKKTKTWKKCDKSNDDMISCKEKGFKVSWVRALHEDKVICDYQNSLEYDIHFNMSYSSKIPAVIRKFKNSDVFENYVKNKKDEIIQLYSLHLSTQKLVKLDNYHLLVTDSTKRYMERKIKTLKEDLLFIFSKHLYMLVSKIKAHPEESRTGSGAFYYTSMTSSSTPMTTTTFTPPFYGSHLTPDYWTKPPTHIPDTSPNLTQSTEESSLSRLPTKKAIVQPLSTKAIVQPLSIKKAIVQPLPTKKAIVQPLPTKKAIVQPLPTKKPIVQPLPTEKAILQPLSIKKPIVQPLSIKKAIVQPLPTKKAIMQPLPTKKAIMQPLPTKKAIVQPLPTEKAILQQQPTYYLPGNGRVNLPFSQEVDDLVRMYCSMLLIENNEKLEPEKLTSYIGDKLYMVIKVEDCLPETSPYIGIYDFVMHQIEGTYFAEFGHFLSLGERQMPDMLAGQLYTYMGGTQNHTWSCVMNAAQKRGGFYRKDNANASCIGPPLLYNTCGPVWETANYARITVTVYKECSSLFSEMIL